jgi:hypothetical protein
MPLIFNDQRCKRFHRKELSTREAVALDSYVNIRGGTGQARTNLEASVC